MAPSPNEPLSPADIATLEEIQRRVLWLAVRMVDHANNREGGEVKVGGHQASCASMVSIMTALWFAHIGGEATVIAVDLADADSIAAAAETIRREIGALDVLVNNAAIHYDSSARASTPDFATIREALDTNLFGAWELTVAALPLLRRSGAARIVNVSSGAGALSEMGGGLPAYKISKVSLNALTLMLADELRRDRILVNAVCPGWVATDMGGGGGRPVADGASGIVWAATLPDDGPTGGFFRDGHPIEW